MQCREQYKDHCNQEVPKTNTCPCPAGDANCYAAYPNHCDAHAGLHQDTDASFALMMLTDDSRTCPCPAGEWDCREKFPDHCNQKPKPEDKAKPVETCPCPKSDMA